MLPVKASSKEAVWEAIGNSLSDVCTAESVGFVLPCAALVLQILPFSRDVSLLYEHMPLSVRLNIVLDPFRAPPWKMVAGGVRGSGNRWVRRLLLAAGLRARSPLSDLI